MEAARRIASRGRRKVAIEPITKKEARDATFSKRRKGILKKAGEIVALCGAQIAVVTHSACGNTFSFGHPSVELVIDQYLAEEAPQAPVAVDAPMRWMERKEGKPPGSQFWWVDSIHQIDLGELETMAFLLEKIRRAILKKVNVPAVEREAPADMPGLQPFAMENGSEGFPAPSVPSWDGN